MTGQASPEAQAWSDFCRRLDQLGQELATDTFADGDRMELFAHMAEQVLCWLSWSVFHADPRRPFFHRQNDLVTQWGGPNADNAYRHARIDPKLRYRILGRMHSCEEFILAVRAGFMHNPVWGTVQEITASDLGIGRGDDFELLLGGGGTETGWIPIPEMAQMVSIREYYFDWKEAEPATFTIECLDDVDGTPLTAAALAHGLSEAASQTEQSMRYWSTYQQEQAAERVPNSFTSSQQVAKGLRVARCAFCFYTLEQSEALLIDTDLPEARYWSFQLYSLGGFEPVDLTERITSLNNNQTAIDDDGRARVVVSARDPGVANWLDTGGRPRGMLIFRWFWPTGEGAPDPTATVVPLDQVQSDSITATARAETMAARRAHLAWRFRV